jgi:RNA polymerase sigma factor (sigma-70 family)
VCRHQLLFCRWIGVGVAKVEGEGEVESMGHCGGGMVYGVRARAAAYPCPALGRARFVPYFRPPKISALLVRLNKQMSESTYIALMSEEDQRITDVIAREQGRLRTFIRKRVPNEADVEDVLQEVFYELVEAYRLMKPVQHFSAWMFQVARNRIIDLFRAKKTDALRNDLAGAADGAPLLLEDLLPSPNAGPEADYARNVLMEEIDAALEELPDQQRQVFIAHELLGYSFKELAAQTGVSVNTLLSRKHYAVRHLRKRLQVIYDEFAKT